MLRVKPNVRWGENHTSQVVEDSTLPWFWRTGLNLPPMTIHKFYSINDLFLPNPRILAKHTAFPACPLTHSSSFWPLAAGCTFITGCWKVLCIVERIFCRTFWMKYALLAPWGTWLWDTGGSPQHWLTAHETPLMNRASPPCCPFLSCSWGRSALLRSFSK